MSDDTFIASLRSLDVPFVVDGDPVGTPIGFAYPAMSTDGRRVVITRLAPALSDRVRDADALLHVLADHAIGGGAAEGGAIYFVEAPPAGEPLSARLAREGPLTSAALHPIAVRAAESLRVLQTTRGPHGLVAPASLVVDRDGSVTFRWSGLFAALRASGVAPEVLGGVVGGATHLAPELQRGEAPSPASDVFGLGTTLYEALTGRPPFGGRTTATVMATVLADSPGGHRPAPLTAAVLRAIEQRPGDRWADARQFADAIQGRHSTAPRPLAKKRRVRPVGVVAIGLGALLLWWLID